MNPNQGDWIVHVFDYPYITQTVNPNHLKFLYEFGIMFDEMIFESMSVCLKSSTPMTEREFGTAIDYSVIESKYDNVLKRMPHISPMSNLDYSTVVDYFTDITFDIYHRIFPEMSMIYRNEYWWGRDEIALADFHTQVMRTSVTCFYRLAL